MSTTRTYKVYSAKYLVKPKEGLPFTVPANPIKFHTELYKDGILSAFLTRNSYDEARDEGEKYVRTHNEHNKRDGEQTNAI